MDNTKGISNCGGNKKAVLIGINYYNQEHELRGCINDVNNIRSFIVQNYNFLDQGGKLWILTDDQQNMRNLPTRSNIIDAMHWLVKDAQPNDSLFFHYSGHGSQARDTNGDEQDGFDETILPVDYAKNGMITDDEINEILVRRLPQKARLTAVFDSCHSGSVMDLPYLYDHYGRLKSFKPEKIVFLSAVNIGKKYLAGDREGMISAFKEGLSNITGLAKFNKQAEEITKQTKSTLADVIMFSGCKDNQTSADAKINEMNTGAMSHALIQALKKDPFGYTYLSLLNEVRNILRDKYSQKAQLSSGREMDMEQQFIM